MAEREGRDNPDTPERQGHQSSDSVPWFGAYAAYNQYDVDGKHHHYSGGDDTAIVHNHRGAVDHDHYYSVSRINDVDHPVGYYNTIQFGPAHYGPLHSDDVPPRDGSGRLDSPSGSGGVDSDSPWRFRSSGDA